MSVGQASFAVALTEIDSQLLKQCLTQGPRAWQDFVDRFIGLFVHVIQHTAHARSIRLTNDDVMPVTFPAASRLNVNRWNESFRKNS